MLRDRYLVTEGVMRLPEHRAIRFHEHKAIWQPQAQPYDPKVRALFRIGEDPGETDDLLSQSEHNESAVETFEDLVRGGADTVPAFTAPAEENAEVDPRVLERLRSLGYVK